MTLLDDIIDGASGHEAVSTLLRKLKIVAARTGTPALGTWVDQELHGYAVGEDVPAYRGPIETIVLGHFVGSFREAQNVPIPPSTFPEELANGGLFVLWIKNSIAELEQWAREESVSIAWPSDALRYYNHGVHTGSIRRTAANDMALVTAVRPVRGSVFLGIIDAVRTRVLDLALELEQVAPTAGQSDTSTDEKAQAANVINNFNFNGSSNNIAVSSSDFTQNVTPPGPGDTDGLIRYLETAGLPANQINELRGAIAEDQRAANESGETTRWERTRGWLTQAVTDVSTGALGGIAGTALTAALASFGG